VSRRAEANVFEIRVHGRGGQGVVTAAEMLSVAAFQEGRHAQAFPSFGSERTGAPVVSFCRIDDKPIRLREPVQRPHAVIIADPTVVAQVDVLGGLRADGYLLVNSGRGFDELGLAEVVARLPRGHATVVPATALALQHVGRAVPNAGLLGGFAAMTGLMSLGAVRQAIEERFPARIAAGNIVAAQAAFDRVTLQIAQLSGASHA
jgi:pyruvate ferredoxin oxidoreductase gamma subunit